MSFSCWLLVLSVLCGSVAKNDVVGKILNNE